MVNKITSLSNQKIISYSKLNNHKFRNESGLFLVEGEKALNDIINNNISVRDILITDESMLSKISEAYNITIVSEHVMKKVSSSVSVPKILTIAEQKVYKVSDFVNFNRVILLENISDSGNLGTIIRSAAAFEFEGIILLGDCVDMYNSKVIRSAAGNFFKIPILKIKNLTDEFNDFKIYTTYLHSDKSTYADKIIPEKKFILSFGSEASGLTSEFMKNSSENVIIKTNNVESLNLATSAAILMYEFSKH